MQGCQYQEITGEQAGAKHTNKTSKYIPKQASTQVKKQASLKPKQPKHTCLSNHHSKHD